MLIADALSHYAPLAAPAIPLDVSVNHLHITPQKKIDFKDAVCSDPTLPSRDDPLRLARRYT